MSSPSAAPAAASSHRGRAGDSHGWWRSGVIYQVYVRSFRDAASSDPEVGQKLPPNSAGWFLLEARSRR